jgi:hypothetical protein
MRAGIFALIAALIVALVAAWVAVGGTLRGAAFIAASGIARIAPAFTSWAASLFAGAAIGSRDAVLVPIRRGRAFTVGCPLWRGLRLLTLALRRFFTRLCGFGGAHALARGRAAAAHGWLAVATSTWFGRGLVRLVQAEFLAFGHGGK